jgi:hypothetical protein
MPLHGCMHSNIAADQQFTTEITAGNKSVVMVKLGVYPSPSE